MKIQPFLTYFYFSLVLSFLTLSLSSCKDDDPTPEELTGTVSDIEGNVYPTVKIGDQIWMAKNLRTTQYNDGSVIDYPGIDTLEWQNNTTGAIAWQNNNEMLKDIYGGLYNWYAINNSRGLCPAGWRVSTPEDWRILLKYLLDEHGLTNDHSGDNCAGNALKSCRQVDSPMGGDCDTDIHPRWNFNETQYGTDDFGFAAFPGGIRDANGVYKWMGFFAYWWAHDPIIDTGFDATQRFINYDQCPVYGMQKRDKNSGLSVRCVKN